MERCFEVRGKVQNVMFRQTLIRATLKLGLAGGASNDRTDKQLVCVTLRGDDGRIDELIALLRSGTPLNDWGAQATHVDEVDCAAKGKPLDAHQVTTTNVDLKKWNPNVTMFI